MGKRADKAIKTNHTRIVAVILCCGVVVLTAIGIVFLANNSKSHSTRQENSNQDQWVDVYTFRISNTNHTINQTLQVWEHTNNIFIYQGSFYLDSHRKKFGLPACLQTSTPTPTTTKTPKTTNLPKTARTPSSPGPSTTRPRSPTSATPISASTTPSTTTTDRIELIRKRKLIITGVITPEKERSAPLAMLLFLFSNCTETAQAVSALAVSSDFISYQVVLVCGKVETNETISVLEFAGRRSLNKTLANLDEKAALNASFVTSPAQEHTIFQEGISRTKTPNATTTMTSSPVVFTKTVSLTNSKGALANQSNEGKPARRKRSLVLDSLQTAIVNAARKAIGPNLLRALCSGQGCGVFISEVDSFKDSNWLLGRWGWKVYDFCARFNTFPEISLAAFKQEGTTTGLLTFSVQLNPWTQDDEALSMSVKGKAYHKMCVGYIIGEFCYVDNEAHAEGRIEGGVDIELPVTFEVTTKGLNLKYLKPTLKLTDCSSDLDLSHNAKPSTLATFIPILGPLSSIVNFLEWVGLSAAQLVSGFVDLCPIINHHLASYMDGAVSKIFQGIGISAPIPTIFLKLIEKTQFEVAKTIPFPSPCLCVWPIPIARQTECKDVYIIQRFSNSPCEFLRSFGPVGSNSMFVSQGCQGVFRCGGRTVHCYSHNYHRRECSCGNEVTTRTQTSNTQCLVGERYGVAGHKKMYVDKGCQGHFSCFGAHIFCASHDYGKKVCDCSNAVQLKTRYSNAACTLGDTFGIDRPGWMYVDNGCRGLFIADGAWVACGSSHGRRAVCSTAAAPVRLIQRFSRSSCTLNRSFGLVDTNKIFVSGGCRGRFSCSGRPFFDCASHGYRRSICTCR
eukprot:m.39409 g.39409  ORF g.39409 m.39409 type:complete len:848 (-) comp16627_c0_seq5:102-2645(-)